MRSTLSALDNVVVMPIFSVNSLMLKAIRTWAPHFLIVDFPHTSAMPALTSLRYSPELRDTWFVALRMFNTELADPEYGLFDYHIEAEPGACYGLDRTRVIDANVLLNQKHLQRPSEEESHVWDVLTTRGYRGKASRALLVMQTGSPDERLWMVGAARHWAQSQKQDYVIIPSSNLPQPAARFMPFAQKIFAASGYSTSWEVFAHDRVGDAVFINLDRPLENLGLRLKTIALECKRDAERRNALLAGTDVLKTNFTNLIRKGV
jgi:hypothetical protein